MAASSWSSTSGRGLRGWRAVGLGLGAGAVAMLVGACGATSIGGQVRESKGAIVEAAPAPHGDDLLTEVVPGQLVLNGEPRELEGVEIEPEAQLGDRTSPAVIGVVDAEAGDVVVVPYDLSAGEPTGELFILIDGETWSAEDVRVSAEDLVTAKGTATNQKGKEAPFELLMPLGIGTSTFELQGSQAIVRGELGSRTLEQVEYLIDAHPEVRTLVLQQINGSVDDEVNVETGRAIRRAGLATHVPSDGEIYSGGVDLFAAGVTRTVSQGAVLGVHSWCCDPDGVPVAEIPPDDPAHQFQLSYFEEMLGAEKGPAFYFFTLHAAPFDDIHLMEAAELAQFELVTA